MSGVRNALAVAFLAGSLSVSFQGSAAAAECAALPPVPHPAAVEAVGRYIVAGEARLACLSEDFRQNRDAMGHQEKAGFVARLNALEYRLDQLRLEKLAATRAAERATEGPGGVQTAEAPPVVFR